MNLKDPRTNWRHILILVILAILVGGGILGWQYWSMLEKKCVERCPEIYRPVCGLNGITYDNKCIAECYGVEIAYEGECKPEKQVTITTDKTEYEVGESVKITVKNDLNKDVCYFTPAGSDCYKTPYIVYQFFDEKWEYRRTGDPSVMCIQVVRPPVCEEVIQSGKLIEFVWNQKVMEDICPAYKKEAECQASSGKYKISLKIGDLGEIYSNEFTIKEKIEEETTNWKTYRNEKLGFEIKYPEDYIIKEETLTKVKVLSPAVIVKAKPFPTEEWREYEAHIVRINIDVYNNSNGLSLNKWLDLVKPPILYREKFSVNRIEGIKGFSFSGGACQKEIYFSKGDKIYGLSLEGGSPGGSKLCEGEVCIDCGPCCFDVSGEMEMIFNQILSTFRFLE